MNPHPNTASSQWYQESIAAIEAVLANLPPETPLDTVKALIRDAYPFGSRENHPYKMWLKARKHLLLEWRGVTEISPGGPRFTLRIVRGDLPWLDVLCWWCARPSGCLACGSLRLQARKAIEDPAFQAMRQAVRGDKLGRFALCDWLQEYHGIEVHREEPNG